MSVDRGGLNYPIAVSYEGTDEIAAFRKDIDSAKKDWESLKASLATGAKVAAPVVPSVSSPGGATGVAAGPTAGASPVAAITAQTAAVSTATRTWSQYFQTLVQGSGQANQAAGVLLNTFERIFARVVIIGAIRQTASEFTSFITEMITFNSTIEQTTLGISSLLLALGHMKDANGDGVGAARGFALAQQEAGKQTTQLRIDALQTASSFENLVKAFQTAIAPGLQAGLNLDEIRKFTVQISQAASAIGVPQTQLAEEIRSLLAGTISVRNTRVATSLGISNDDIKKAKELGNLVGFLNDKFAAFGTAGEAALNTFDVVLTNLKDAISQIIGSGGIDFFNVLKKLFQDIQGSLVKIDPLTQKLTLNPQAIAVVKSIADAFEKAVVRVRELGNEFVYGDLIKGAAFLGTVIGIAFDLVTAAIQGTVRGAHTLADIFEVLYTAALSVLEVIKAVTGVDLFDQAKLTDVVASFFQVLTILKGIQFTLATITALGSLLLNPLVAGVVLMGLLAEGTRQWASQVTGVNLKYSTLFQLIAEKAVFVGGAFVSAAITGFGLLLSSLKVVGEEVIDFMQTNVDKLLPIALSGFAAILQKIQDSLPKSLQSDLINDIISKAKSASDLIAAGAETNHKIRLGYIEKELQANEAAAFREKALQDQLAKADELASKAIIAGNDKNPDLKELISNAFAKAKAAVGGSGLFGTDISGADKDAKNLAKTLETLPGIITPSLESFKAQAKIMHDLDEASIKANAELREGLQVLQLTGPILNERKNVFEAENKQRELSKQLVVDEKGQQQLLTGIIAQRALIEEKIDDLTQGQQVVLKGNLENTQDLLAAQKALGETKDQQKVLDHELTKALADGNAEVIAGVREKINANQDYNTSLQAQIESLKDISARSFQGMEIADAQKIVGLIEKKITLAGQEKSVEEQIQKISNDKLDISLMLNKAAADKNNLLAQQNTLELANKNVIQAIQNANDARSFNNRYALPEVAALAAAQGALALQRAQAEQAQKLRQVELANLDVLIKQNEALLVQAKLRSIDVTDEETLKKRNEAILSIQQSIDSQVKQRAALQQQNELLTEKETLATEKLAFAEQHARDVIEKPISTGLLDGIRKAAQELPSLYQGTVDTIKSIVTGLTDFISQSIVDAFDPTKKEDITARFAKFLQSIAKQVLDMFIHLAIVKAVLGLGFLGDGGGVGAAVPSLGGLGFAQGGPIGYADGGAIGSVRPYGMNPHDTEHIWAQPGEFMQPVSSVMKYGADVMEKMRRGLIDPYSLRQLAGSQLNRGASSPRIAEAVSSSLATARQSGVAQSVKSSQNQGIQQPHPAYIVANEAALDKLLASGRNSMFNFFDTHKGRIRGIIG